MSDRGGDYNTHGQEPHVLRGSEQYYNRERHIFHGSEQYHGLELINCVEVQITVLQRPRAPFCIGVNSTTAYPEPHSFCGSDINITTTAQNFVFSVGVKISILPRPRTPYLVGQFGGLVDKLLKSGLSAIL